jgi:glutamyl-tRNA synthetase
MDWGNCILKAVHKDSSGKVTGIDGELHLEGDFKKTRLKLTWLCDVPDLVPLRVVDLGHLITKAKVRSTRPCPACSICCCLFFCWLVCGRPVP